MKFKDLSIDDTFDFIDDERPGYNSFYEKCKKISARRYQSESGMIHRVGSIKAEVYHVNENE